MNNRHIKGVITIEAAIVVPAMLIFVLLLASMVRIIYTQEEMHHCLTEAASIMADTGYIYESTGLSEVQQLAYDTAKDRESAYENRLADLEANKESLLGYGLNFNIPSQPEISLEGNNIVDVARSWLTEINTIRITYTQFMAEVLQSAGNLYELVGYIFEDGTLLYDGISQSGFIATTNGYGAEMLAKGIMMGYHNQEEWTNIGVADGYKGMDFKGSSYMLKEDDIVLKVTYKVKLPLISGLFEGVTLTDQVICHAFVGNGNYKTTIKRTDEEKKTKEGYVYITEHGHRYHIDASCFHIHIEAHPIPYSLVIGEVDLCKSCGQDVTLTPMTILYTTDSDSKYHINSQCHHIVREPTAIPIAMAKAMGYTPCLHCSKGD